MDGDPFSCIICYERYNGEKNLPATFLCGHTCCIYHTPTLKGHCPMCRANIPNSTDMKPNVQLRDGAIKYDKLIAEIEKLRGKASSKTPRSISDPNKPSTNNTLHIAGNQLVKSVFDWITKDNKKDTLDKNEKVNEIKQEVILNDEERIKKIQSRLQVLQLEKQHLQDELDTYYQSQEQAAFELRKIQEEADEALARELQIRLQGQINTDEEYARRLQEQIDRGEEGDLSLETPNEPDENLAEFFEQEFNDLLARNSPRQRIPILMKSCGHECQLSNAVPNCCWCSDGREISNGYENYVDGVGWQNQASRDQFYCMECVGKNDRTRK